MKRFTLFFALMGTVIISSAFNPKPIESNAVQLHQDSKIELPDNIKEIVEVKCMNCHKPDARNEKAREKLQWVKVPEMNKEQQEDFIAEMFEVIEDGDMPPARMVERNPKMKLTDEENKAFMAWLEKEEKRLKGK
ncbi:heme-binding domain-containing protein [Roseivirga spongicola]|nr:heme-binding domain-containing protein [Roseivirga spongicola]WPZ09148.1 heme-binding domain-containing protein [Roseivirga spongicola]